MIIQRRASSALIPGVAVCLKASIALSQDLAWVRGVGCGLLAVGLVLLVRGFRAAVMTTHEAMTIRGLLRNRTIPRSAIVQITGEGWAGVTWIDARGEQRVTPVWVLFNSPRGDPDVRYLRRYAREGRGRRTRSRA